MVRRDIVSMSSKARLVGMASLQIEFACAFAKYIVIENGCMDQMRELVDEAMDILSDDDNDNRSDDDSDDEQQVYATTVTVQATPNKKASSLPSSRLVTLEPDKHAESVRKKETQRLVDV